MRKILFILIGLLATPSFGQSMDSMILATSLGNVLASESECDLVYDQAAIAKYIEENVPADDMTFASTLNMMTQGSEMQIRDMSTSAKTAHCTQTRRVAKNYGFIE